MQILKIEAFHHAEMRVVVIFRNAHLVLKAFKNVCKTKSNIKASVYIKIGWIWFLVS